MDGNAFETLCRWSRWNGGADAILATVDRVSLSWARLPETLVGLADVLAATGVGRMSRIALMLPAGPEAVTACLAAMRVGVAVPLNPELTAAELATSLARLRPHLLVFRAGLPGRAESVAGSLGIPTLRLDWSSRDRAGEPRIVASATATAVAADDPLAAPPGTQLILQTSGTTAEPKLVPLTGENLETSAAALIASLGLTAADRGLNLLPQFHIGGLWDLVAGPLLAGGSVICGGAFSLTAFEAGCAREPTWVQLVPPMLRALMRPPTATLPRGLRFIRSVSAALPPALKAEAEATLGVSIVEIYGMTETAGVITSNPLDSARQRPGSVGLRVGPDITIRDASGMMLPPGREGEVVIGGAQVSPGYIAAAPSDASAFAADGFHTGDLGRFDHEGNLWLVGRRKDLINRGGEKIAPAEIEVALLAVPGVVDAAVFGFPHPSLGEEIAAAIVSAEPEDADALAARVQTGLRSVLGHGRLPARIHVVASIPRTAGGKLHRRVLTERYGHADAVPTVAEAQDPPQDRMQSWPEAILPRWVAEIWAPILSLEVMGPDENFFLAGGGSLQAAQAAAIIQDRFPEEIVYVTSVYQAPTPALQAAFIETHYPTIAARILGRAARLEAMPVEPVTGAMRDRFRAVIADPLPHLPVPATRNPRAIFIIGAPRSGSTLLRAMLAGHPRLFAPPELYLLSHTDLAARRAWYGSAHASQLEGLPRALMGATGVPAANAIAATAALEADAAAMPETYRLLQAAIGERILVDKTPFYGVHRHVLSAANAVFEDVFFIHLSRHPYGMIRSFEEAKLAQLWWPRLIGPDATPCAFHPRQLAEMIWERIHANVVSLLADQCDETWLHVRYEDLVDDPEGACRRITSAIGLEFDRGMLEPFRDPAARMTDGLHPGSRMIGDPKFHGHQSIDRSVADRWQHHFDSDFLSEQTMELAAALGYRTRIGTASSREIFDV